MLYAADAVILAGQVVGSDVSRGRVPRMLMLLVIEKHANFQAAVLVLLP
jgi:hypothetical protein